MRYLWIGAACLLAAWLVAAGYVLSLMHQAPVDFAHSMSRMPDAVMMVIPFKSLWLYARNGSLDIGDPAPDFTLPRLDDQKLVQLSNFRGHSPVVLVFGSYT
jgi:hypothetical protein